MLVSAKDSSQHCAPLPRAFDLAFCLSWLRLELQARQGLLQIPGEGGEFPIPGGRLGWERFSLSAAAPGVDLASSDLLPDFF